MEQNVFNVSVHFVDSSGTVVPALGTEYEPWVAKISRRSGSGPSDCQLKIPNDTAVFVDGYANFSDLYFIGSGQGFILDVIVVSPSHATNFSIASSALTVAPRKFQLSAVGTAPRKATKATGFGITVQLSNEGSTTPAINLDWKVSGFCQMSLVL